MCDESRGFTVSISIKCDCHWWSVEKNIYQKAPQKWCLMIRKYVCLIAQCNTIRMNTVIAKTIR